MKQISVAKIIEFLNTEECEHIIIDNGGGKIVSFINNPYDASATDLIFIGEERNDAVSIIASTKAEVIIAGINFLESINSFHVKNKTFILLENPRCFFSLIFNCFFNTKHTASIAGSAVIHPSVSIGENVVIREFVVIEEDCVIGDNCIIDSNVVIKKSTIIGNGVKIYAGAVLGSDGFGFAKYKNTIINFPHISGVIIKDNVEIGANTVIDRGALTDTVIGEGTRVDNLCHIAHNVQIGKNCYIIANSMIGGSSKIMDNVWVAPSVSVRDGLTVGKNALLGMAANVTVNVPDGEVWVGNPAKKIR